MDTNNAIEEMQLFLTGKKYYELKYWLIFLLYRLITVHGSTNVIFMLIPTHLTFIVRNLSARNTNGVPIWPSKVKHAIRSYQASKISLSSKCNKFTMEENKVKWNRY